MISYKVPWCWIDEQTETLFNDILDWLQQYTPTYELIDNITYFSLIFESQQDLLRFKLAQSRPITTNDMAIMQRILVRKMAKEIQKDLDAKILESMLGFAS